MIPLILLNCEKILHVSNVTTYEQTLFSDRHSVNSEIHFCKEEIEKNFLRRNAFFYHP